MLKFRRARVQPTTLLIDLDETQYRTLTFYVLIQKESIPPLSVTVHGTDSWRSFLRTVYRDAL